MDVVDILSKKGDIYIITGPTAGGKTDIAQSLALRINGEISSADSRVMYRDLKIGTGAYTIDNLDSTHMVAFLGLKERYSIHDYLIEVAKIVDDIRSRGKNIIICGNCCYHNQMVIFRSFYHTNTFDGKISISRRFFICK